MLIQIFAFVEHDTEQNTDQGTQNCKDRYLDTCSDGEIRNSMNLKQTVCDSERICNTMCDQ